jgi:glycolate oxidase FAD binding subunit
MLDSDLTEKLKAQVKDAAAAERALSIRGGGSKEFYGREPEGEPLELGGHRGILSYEPTELVITARGGTPLQEVEKALAEQGQMLPFEPPYFASGSTIGGTVASGLAGPRRPWGGAPRDLLLGVKLLDGNGRVLQFGGQVMKNVAGYDISRLMAGAMGTLGVLLEVSLKVLPRPPEELTLARSADAATALGLMETLQGRPLPLTGACHLDGRLYLRLATGRESAARLAGEIGAKIVDADVFWSELRDQRLAFFDHGGSLWRLSVPPASEPAIDGEVLIDWGGAQRWLKSEAPARQVREAAARVGGHAILFRNGDRSGEVFQPLEPPLEVFHRRLKQVFDPRGILNPGRLYAAF